MNDLRRIAESSREAVKLIETLPSDCANRAKCRCQGSQLARARPFEVEAIECFKALHLRAFPTAATIESAETINY